MPGGLTSEPKWHSFTEVLQLSDPYEGVVVSSLLLEALYRLHDVIVTRDRRGSGAITVEILTFRLDGQR